MLRYYLPSGKGEVLHSRKLESPLQRDALCKARLKLAQCFWRKRFLKVCQWFSLLCFYLPLENGVILHLNKLGFPLPRDAMCQVWLKLPQKSEMRKVYKRTDIKTTDDKWAKKIYIAKQPTYIAVWVNMNVFNKKKKTENKTGE